MPMGSRLCWPLNKRDMREWLFHMLTIEASPNFKQRCTSRNNILLNVRDVDVPPPACMQGLKGVRIALRLQNILPSGEDPSGQLSKTERPNVSEFGWGLASLGLPAQHHRPGPHYSPSQISRRHDYSERDRFPRIGEVWLIFHARPLDASSTHGN